jgi:guanylate kinase
MAPDANRSDGRLLIFSAPSGSGKTTIVRHLLASRRDLEFSVSATSRPPRGKEEHGKDYYFLSEEEFRQKAMSGDFLEWEEVYRGAFYGTLRKEVERIWNKGHHVIFDMDVVGGLNLKRHFGERALAVFVMPPNLKELERRLRSRGTDSEDKIRQRLDKAEQELVRSSEFDHVLINENLEDAKREAQQIVSNFLR